MGTKQLSPSATHPIWAWVAGIGRQVTWCLEMALTSALRQVLKQPLSSGFKAFFLLFRNTVGPETTETNRKITFRELSFSLLPSSLHQGPPSIPCSWFSRALPHTTVLGESLLSRTRVTLALLSPPYPRLQSVSSADLVIDGDIVGTKVGIASMWHSFYVSHPLLSLVADLSHLITPL